MVKAGKGFRAAEISFIAKVLVAMGAKRMKELNDAIYGGYEVDLGYHVKLTKMKIAITYGRLRGARGRLAGRYLHGGSKPIAQIVPRLRAVADASGKLIGAVADVKMAHMLAAKIALESEELQREFDPLYNERVRGLGERHIAVLGGLTRDLFPVNKRAAVTQMSAFNGNIKSKSNSPHNHMCTAFVRAKEDDALMHEQYAAADRALAELRASAAANGEPIELTPPQNARYCSAPLRGVKGLFFLHFVFGWFEHNDGKMDALLYRAARGSAPTARCGGIRFDVKKIALLKPRGRIAEPNDPTATNADYVCHTD